MKIGTILFGMFFCIFSSYGEEVKINKLTDTQVIALTLLMEARGEVKSAGMLSVGQVIRNRSLGSSMTPREVCLQRYQFSCWNGKNSVNREFANSLLSSKVGWEAWWIAEELVKRDVDPRVTNCRYYYCKNIPEPKWAYGKDKIQIGNHLFL